MKELGVGIVGCGVISTIYMQNLAAFRGVRLVACADLWLTPHGRRPTSSGSKRSPSRT